MDSKKLMTVEEVKAFFANTEEFKVSEEGEYIKLAYTDDSVNATTSILILTERVNIQQLIRKITQLVWNNCNNILD